MTEDFSPGEVRRGFQSITDSQREITAELKELRAEMGRTYVPRGEWAEARKGDRQRLAGVEEDVDTLKRAREGDQSWRRTSSLTLAVAAVGWILTILALVLTVVLK